MYIQYGFVIFDTDQAQISSVETKRARITINVPVVYMALDVMILMQANPLQGSRALENRDF